LTRRRPIIKGGIVDGASVFQNREGVTAIEAGKGIATIDFR
jgi:hypothetical protein